MYNTDIESLLIKHTSTKFRHNLFLNAMYLMNIEFGKLDDDLLNYIMEYVRGYIEIKDIKAGLIRRFEKNKRNDGSMPLWDNKLHIYKMETLREAIISIGIVNVMKLDFVDFWGFNYNTYKNMHKSIFGDIFPWAGEERTISLKKKIDFLDGRKHTFLEFDEIEPNVKKVMVQIEDLSNLSSIDEAIREILRSLNVDWSDLNDDEKAVRLADAVGELWMIHPFIEGNITNVFFFAMKFSENNRFPMDRKSIMELHYENDIRKALFLASLSSSSEYHDVDFLSCIFSVAIIEGKKKYFSKVTPVSERKSLRSSIEKAEEELARNKEEGEYEDDDDNENG